MKVANTLVYNWPHLFFYRILYKAILQLSILNVMRNFQNFALGEGGSERDVEISRSAARNINVRVFAACTAQSMYRP
jgi:hypothetical protein